MGMTEWQILTKVEVPLGLPLLIGGIRAARAAGRRDGDARRVRRRRRPRQLHLPRARPNDYAEMLGGSILVIALAIVLEIVFSLLQRVVVPAASPPDALGRPAAVSPSRERARNPTPGRNTRDHSNQERPARRRRGRGRAPWWPWQGARRATRSTAARSDSSATRRPSSSARSSTTRTRSSPSSTPRPSRSDGFTSPPVQHRSARGLPPAAREGRDRRHPRVHRQPAAVLRHEDDRQDRRRDRRRPSRTPCRGSPGPRRRRRRPTRTATPSRRSSPRRTTSRAWPT